MKRLASLRVAKSITGTPARMIVMELAREQQVVRRAERLLAEVGEGEARDAAVRRRDFDLAGADAQASRSWRRIARQPPPGRIERRARLRGDRRMV